MKTRHLKIISLIFSAGLFLFMLNAVVMAQEEQAVRLNETRTVKEIQGRIDSVRPDKIVVSYEPQDQPGTTLQTYFYREEDIRFSNRNEDKLKAGDIVTVTYVESDWQDEKGVGRKERKARNIRFVRARDIEELKEKTQVKSDLKGIKDVGGEDEPQ